MEIATDELFGTVTSPNRFVDESLGDVLIRLRAIAADDLDWQRKIDLALLYGAESVDGVPISDSAYVRRAYNVLSTDHLLSLGRRADDHSLIVAAFARFVALENWSKAEGVLDELKDALPKSADEIDQIANLSEPLPVRMSLIAIHTPGISTLVIGGDAGVDLSLWLWNGNLLAREERTGGLTFARRSNLPSEYGSGQFLQRDFEVWLRLPQRNAFHGTGGSALPWFARMMRRVRFADRSVSAPALFREGPRNRSARFERLIAREEIARLAGRNRLLHTASREIIRWAAASTSTVVKRKLNDHETAAQALSRLIYLCRFESCGEYNNKPAQQRAFMLIVGLSLIHI